MGKRRNIKGWDVMCNVEAIVFDVKNYMGILHVNEFNSPDMAKTIYCFQSVDPSIKRIDVYTNNEPDVMYLKQTDDDTWRAINLINE